MLDLSKQAGLPICLDNQNHIFSGKISVPKISIRTYDQISAVLMEPKTSIKEFYYIYQGIGQNETFEKAGLRYDITVMPPLLIGKEFSKTVGHYHASARPGLSWPEVYQVIHGQAYYLLQKEEKEKIKDVVVCKAKAGEIIFVPPNYGHVIINPTNKTAVMANMVNPNFKSEYECFLKRHGGAYYCISKAGKPEFIPNKNYGNLPKIRFAKMAGFGLRSPVYSDYLENHEKYDFLTKPWNFTGQFP